MKIESLIKNSVLFLFMVAFWCCFSVHAQSPALRVNENGQVIVGGGGSPETGGVLNVYGTTGPAIYARQGAGNIIYMKSTAIYPMLGEALVHADVAYYGTSFLNFRYNNSPQIYMTALGNVVSKDFSLYADSERIQSVSALSNSLQKILQLRGVKHIFKDDGNSRIGLVAQEVQAVIPEVVTSEKGGKCVSYPAIVALLLEAVKEQQTMINNLTNEVNALKAK